MKKTITALLFSSMIITAFASCSQDTGNNADTTAADSAAETTTAETTEAKLTDSVPELDFGGVSYRIASSRRDWYDGRITQSEQTGEVLDDALYKRSRDIEERFNIVFNETVIESPGIAKTVETAVLAGDDLYEVAFPTERDALTLAQNNYIYALNDIEYVDPSMPWWPKDINDKLTIGGVLYFAANDMNMTTYDYTMLLLYNLKMIEDYNLDDPVAMIYDGTWTFDKFNEMGMAVLSDTDGDGEWTDLDTYGFVSDPKQVIPNLGIAANVEMVKKDSDDIPYFSMETDEKYATVFNRIYEITWDSGIWFSSLKSDNARGIFIDDRCLFYSGSLSTMRGLRDMETDFGALFYPKYEESQDDYHTRVQGGLQVNVVPSTCTDTELAGAIIEATAAASYHDVIPTLYEINLKGKYARDEATIEMLDYIMAQRTIDLGDTLWCNQIRDAFIRVNFTNNNRDLASAIAANKDSVSKIIADAVAVFKK